MHQSIQPFDLLDSNEVGTFWTQTNTNSIAVPFMTDSKVVTNKVRIFINSTAGAKIRCAIYKKESCTFFGYADAIVHRSLDNFVDIPFETIATLDSDTLYFFAFECSSSDSTFLGKQINAGLMSGLLCTKETLLTRIPTLLNLNILPDGVVDGNVFIPYFKII
jgi:hypothetical protein